MVLSFVRPPCSGYIAKAISCDDNNNDIKFHSKADLRVQPTHFQPGEELIISRLVEWIAIIVSLQK